MYDFFERQAKARSETRQLIVLLCLSVVAVVLSVNLAVYVTTSGAFVSTHRNAQQAVNLVSGFFTFLQSAPALWTSLTTVLLISGGSVFRMWQLSGSADKVAEMLGGRRVQPHTADPAEKRLLNVVEEMAIAAGMKVPRVFLLPEEQGINAFASGLNPNDAIIAVTRGALDSLTRDELQGVVAHEFSHILNSDMRLNTQLIGLLAGILLIGRIGQHLMETSNSSYSQRKNNAGLLGILLFVIGLVGLFFGQLIKAAISRQREFLADASAVQFTRLPEGIGMALMKIRKSMFSSTLRSAQAEEVSHMCFGASKRAMLSSLLATHPPIEERIKAIDPSLLKRDVLLAPAFDTTQGNPDEPPGYPSSPSSPDGAVSSLATYQPPPMPSDQNAWVSKDAGHIKASIGTIDDEAMTAASALHAGLHPALLEAAHDPDRSMVLLCAIANAAPQRKKGANLPAPSATSMDEADRASLASLTALVASSPLQARIPLSQILMTTLEAQDSNRRDRTLALLREVINADGAYTLAECAIFLSASKYLAPVAGERKQINSMSAVVGETATLLTALAHASGQVETARTTAVDAAMKCLGLPTVSTASSTLSAATLSASLSTLARLSPLLKRSLVETAVDMVIADRKVTLAEFEMIRCFCELLDCPMPAAMAAYGQ